MKNSNSKTPIEILYIEDDPGDVMLVKEVLKEIDAEVNLNVVAKGKDALDYLNCRGSFTTAVRPDLIWLDLNLPGMDGREVLAYIKGADLFKTIPVVILTTSDADADIAKTYAMGASSYVTKPLGLEGFVTLVKSMESFWFTIVKYPPKETQRQ